MIAAARRTDAPHSARPRPPVRTMRLALPNGMRAHWVSSHAASILMPVAGARPSYRLKSASVLGECVSTCERIYNTPIPLAYSRHTSRFLVLYVSTLPLVLVSTIGWTTVPVMVTISWALFGILEIGNLIEEPFTAIANSNGQPLLPLKEVCRIIRRDVRACAQYAALAKNYSVPSIRRSPMGKVALPEGFKQLRVLLSAPSSNATMSSNSSRTNADAGS